MSLPRFAPTEYENDDEGRRRILNTVVLKDNKPIRVMDVANGYIHYVPIEDEAGFRDPVYPRIPLNDPSINVFNIPIGYLNLEGHNAAIYTRRRAVRHGVQGLRHNTFLYNPPPELNRYGLDFNTVVRNPGFTRMIAGDYPTHAEAMALMKASEARRSIAFHRRLALVREEAGFPIHIHYRGQRVGWCHGDEVMVPQDKAYMSDILRETRVLR